MSKEITVEYLNPIECRVNAEVAKLIRPVLSFTAVFYQQTPFKKIRKEYQKSTMTQDSKGFYFFSGHKDRVTAHLTKLGYSVTFSGNGKSILKHHPYKAKDLTLRSDQ